MMAIPLIMGFKIASVIVAAMGVLKLLVIKTVFVSGLALIASLAIASKYVYEKIKSNQPVYDTSPYFYQHAMQPYTWEPVYDVQGGGGAQAVSGDYQQSAGDLQGHYSNPVAQTTAVDTATTQNTTSAVYSYTPSNQGIAERKAYFRPHPPLYKTTIYKTVVKEVNK